MKFETGMIENLSYDEYDEIKAYRSSDLTTAIKCIYRWKHQDKFHQTPALIEGRLMHTLFLEPHNFDREFAVQPEVNRRTKEGKEVYAEFLDSLGNKTPIKQAMYETCLERVEVIEDFKPKKEKDSVECTIKFILHGQPFKARFDWYDGKNVWDLKTCRDASPRGFRSAVNMWRYYQQAALYVDACVAAKLPVEGFNFLAQEKNHPYAFATYTLSKEALEYGRAKNEQALNLLLRCKESGEYKPFNVSGFQTIELSDLY
mgnify:FL=1